VSTIPQNELRHQASDVLRRVEAGQTLTITVAGEVAELSPIRRHRWVSGPRLDMFWAGPAPRRMDDDLAAMFWCQEIYESGR
jgi:prevent-host-death family protein